MVAMDRKLSLTTVGRLSLTLRDRGRDVAVITLPDGSRILIECMIATMKQVKIAVSANSDVSGFRFGWEGQVRPLANDADHVWVGRNDRILITTPDNVEIEVFCSQSDTNKARIQGAIRSLEG